MRRDCLALLTGLLLGSASPGPPLDAGARATEIGWDFWDNGKPRARIGLVPVEGGWVRSGAFRQWALDGTLLVEGAMEADRETGPWTKYHPDGGVKKQVNYRAGKLHGPYQSWYESGQLAGQGTFTDGLPSGVWQAWHEDGSIDAERSGTYVDGKLVTQ